jgi:hypothetical protein
LYVFDLVSGGFLWLSEGLIEPVQLVNWVSVLFGCTRSLVIVEAGLFLIKKKISHQPAVLLSHNKPVTSNQPTVLFSQNKSAPAISHQPNEQAARLSVYAHGSKSDKFS